MPPGGLSGNDPLIYPASRCLLFRSEIDDTRARRLHLSRSADGLNCGRCNLVAIHIHCDFFEY